MTKKDKEKNIDEKVEKNKLIGVDSIKNLKSITCENITQDSELNIVLKRENYVKNNQNQNKIQDQNKEQYNQDGKDINDCENNETNENKQ